jgi:hypothetical protein
LSKGEFSDLMELIAAFGAEHGVAFKVDGVRFDEHGEEVT